MKPPVISAELIAYLERMFPDRCPSPNDSERAIWMHVGTVSVTKHLKRIKDQQEENILE